MTSDYDTLYTTVKEVKLVIRISELLERLRISRPTVYAWIERGLPVHYVGKIPFFDVAEVEHWIKEQNKGAS